MHKSHLEVLASFSAKGSHRLGRNGDVVCTLQMKINYPTTLAASRLIILLSEMLKIFAPRKIKSNNKQLWRKRLSRQELYFLCQNEKLHN
jgi:hypothetical protein